MIDKQGQSQRKIGAVIDRGRESSDSNRDRDKTVTEKEADTVTETYRDSDRSSYRQIETAVTDR